MMSNGRKRRREETEAESSDADQSLSLEQNLTFTDTLAALQIMRAQFPQIDKVATLPFILQSQLYSSVKDRTQVDRELESLRREKVVRIFKLNTGQDDHGIMFLDDYLKQIENVVKRMEERKKVDLVVFKWFKVHVIETKLEPCIEHEELCSLLSLGGKVKDEHISLLINAGLLTRQLIDPSRYWFAIPNIGLILKGLSQGRKELLSLLNRRRYKEMMLAPLEKKRLQFSPLDMRFHLRDLIGSGHLKTDHTPTGIVVRVLKEFLNEEQNKTCLNAMYVQINIECRMKFASMSVIWMPTAKQYPQQALPKAQASPRNKGDLPWDCCSYKNDDIYERHNSMHQHYQKIG